ncbi:hypothetical protein J7E88_25215 [Streptomyces sp. ISL-10]|uniref:hypothetical protein n=1 Tax=Streptomyces sp. ISL-10 TaxID=2819172 RepID=UPI001BE9B548|nr:hypothetical protein [Streptomyces sp. ISL-10]MBT2368536.1 hypothetical protein [Streptomyces sp. ISL-10]
MTAPTGTSFLADVLASGYCDSSVQRELGRVLMSSSGSDFGSPSVQGDEDRLVESLIRVDEAWSRVRRTWSRVVELGTALDAERAAVQQTPHESRAARLAALESLPAEAAFRAARSEFAEALSELADAYGS